jgi:DNA mismatch repair protein MutS
VTPGTVTEEEYLDPKQPNYLIALCAAGDGAAVVAVDLSTGETRLHQLASLADARELLTRLMPRELLIDAADPDLATSIGAAVPGAMLTALPAARFDAAAGRTWLAAHGADAEPAVAAALGAVLGYLADTHRASIAHLRAPEREGAAAVMIVDEASRRNLELLCTTRGERRGSLLDVLDETDTPMGGRLLRHWLLAPLTDIAAIGARLDAVESLAGQPSRRDHLTGLLATIGDLERLTARLAAARVTARDLLGLAAALATVAEVQTVLADVDAAALRSAAADLDSLIHCPSCASGSAARSPTTRRSNRGRAS